MAKKIDPALKLISKYLELKDDEYFVIPEYQRGYSWDINQCDKLWQDIEDFIQNDASDPYFFGTIIVDCSEDNQYSLIDGQQRTTTFLLLLKACLIRLMEVLKEFNRDETSEALEEGLKESRNKIIRILYKAGVEERINILGDWERIKGIKIIENNSINELYDNQVEKIIESKNFDEAEKNVHRIPRKQKDNKYTNHFRNFKFFYKKLEQKSESQLNKFCRTFLEKCEIIEIRSWYTEQAITMFNSLNSTGMPLSDADIISAQLYSNSGDQREEFNELWETLSKLANELNAQKIVNIDGILQQFMYIDRAKSKAYVKDNSVDVTTPGLRRYYTDIKKDLLTSPIDLTERLIKIARIWDKIKDYPTIKLLLKFNENAKLFLIGYLNRYQVNDITEQKVIEISNYLIRLFAILEVVDAGYSSKNFKTFLFRENIKLVDDIYQIDSIKNDFDRHIKGTWEKEDIEEGLIEYDKNILVFLNEYLYTKSKNEYFNFSTSVNIEHIMPASGRNIDLIRKDAGIADKEEFKSLVNKLGNKMLLEEKINKSISNEWFKSKKQTSINDKSGYKDSRYQIALSLTNYPKDTWTKEDIEDATLKAAERISNFIFND